MGEEERKGACAEREEREGETERGQTKCLDYTWRSLSGKDSPSRGLKSSGMGTGYAR